MIYILQNQNEVLHNRLRGGSDKEVPANSWGFQTRMGLGQNFQTCSDLCSEILELLPLLMRRKLPWHLFRTRGLPEMRIVPIWQILLLCKSFRILHSQDFKGMASLKEILHHSEISSISNEQIYWATKRCSFGSLIIFLMKTIFNNFNPPSSFPTFPMISWHSSTSTITYFMALGIATEAQYLSKSQLFQRSKYS